MALGKLARKYMLMFAPYKIALTGSTGKTTTKEYLANIFAEKGDVLKSLYNENNIIGLSKTIFRIKPTQQTAVLELGTNHFGEIEQLADICQPDCGIILNIGPSHLECLIDEDGVYKEKSALFRPPLSTCLMPGDDARFEEFVPVGKTVGFNSGCDYRISRLTYENEVLSFALNETLWQVKNTMPYYIMNIAFAIATAQEAGMSLEQIQKGLDKPLRLSNRMEFCAYGRMLVIYDCYNANPVSMQAAIETVGNLEPDRPHIAILGDMLELGEQAGYYHRKVTEWLNKINNLRLFTVGPLASCYAQGIISNNSRVSVSYPDVDELIRHWNNLDLPDEAIILIKGSHGIKLDKLRACFESMKATVSQNPVMAGRED